MLEHGAADHLPRVLPVAQHDALVHDHTWTPEGGCDYVADKTDAVTLSVKSEELRGDI